MILTVKQSFVEDTVLALRAYGQTGLEGVVLWLGSLQGMTAEVTQVQVPPQSSISLDGEVGYIIERDTLLTLNRTLHATGLRLLAQVHSHPQEAYHSELDDACAVATKEGSLSLVVPSFAAGPPDVALWAIYQLTKGKWRHVPRREHSTCIQITA